MKARVLKSLIFGFVFLISTNLLGQTKNKRIEVFSKVWGFLKYHHPTVATGTINWDSVYVNNLSKVEKSVSVTDFDRQLLGIINNLGAFQKTKPAHLPDSLFSLNHNLKWIDQDKLINAQLKTRLKEIFAYRNQKENRYIKLSKETPADYSGELKYEDMVFPAKNYRLLFLARFWNVINYFAPYKYLVGEDWDNVLTRFIPKVINATDTVTYYKTLLQLAKSLNDGHAQLYMQNANSPINDAVFGRYASPLYVDIIDEKVIVRKVVDTNSNVKPGDIILSVDDEPVITRIKAFGKYISASNNNTQNKMLSKVFLNTRLSYQKLKIKRDNKIFTVNINCILANKRSWVDLDDYVVNKTGYKSIGNDIAYVSTVMIWDGTLDSIKTLMRRKKAVIFDVRNYPNGNSAFYALVRSMLPGPTIISTSLKMLPDNPGYFYWEPSPALGSNNGSAYKGKTVILVDERTQSQGEYSAMTLQTIPNAVTVGSQTAGGDGLVTFIPIGGELAISYSGYGVYYPDKTVTQRSGVKISIPVKKTVQSTIKGEDVILQKALNYLKSQGID